VPGYPDEKTLTPGEIGRHILMRRTVRDYTRKPVPKETLLQILEIVRYAPTGMNGQPVHWTVMRDPAQVHDLAGIIIEWATNIVENQQGHTLAPILPMIIEAWKAGIDLVCHDAPGLVIAHGDKDNQNVPVDSVIAMAHLDLVAPSYGLGTCWAGFVRIAADASPEVAEALHLPEGHKSSCAMLIGYPEFRFRRIPKRNALRVTWR
jgi:nitroreductase